MTDALITASVINVFKIRSNTSRFTVPFSSGAIRRQSETRFNSNAIVVNYARWDENDENKMKSRNDSKHFKTWSIASVASIKVPMGTRCVEGAKNMVCRGIPYATPRCGWRDAIIGRNPIFSVEVFHQLSKHSPSLPPHFSPIMPSNLNLNPTSLRPFSGLGPSS